MGSINSLEGVLALEKVGLYKTINPYVLINNLEDNDAILFFSEESVGDGTIDYFSVPSPGSRRSKSHVTGTRAIVVRKSSSSGNSTWTCSRDKTLANECVHVGRAKAHAKSSEGNGLTGLGLADLEEPEAPVRLHKGVRSS